jgi:hypothetical protein
VAELRLSGRAEPQSPPKRMYWASAPADASRHGGCGGVLVPAPLDPIDHEMRLCIGSLSSAGDEVRPFNRSRCRVKGGGSGYLQSSRGARRKERRRL